MLSDQLKFVKGATNTKGIIPELAHFKIEQGRVQGYNGSMALCSPIDVEFACLPEATTFVKAINSAPSDDISLALLKDKLIVSSNKFKVTVKCLPMDKVPHKEPEGKFYNVQDIPIYDIFKTLEPFIGVDAIRPWSRGLFIKGTHIWATNNIIALEATIGDTPFPVPVNIPHDVVKEVIRIKKNPLFIQANESSVTFHYAKDQWVKGKLLATDWPDLEKVLGNKITAEQGKEFNEDMLDAVNRIAHFTDKEDRLYFTPNGIITTHPKDDEGASEYCEDVDFTGVYHANILQSLAGVATHIDFTTYPKPCKFIGDNIQGVVIGLRH